MRGDTQIKLALMLATAGVAVLAFLLLAALHLLPVHIMGISQ